jgi:DNA polymerase-4
MKAAQLCPHAILLPVDFDRYRRYSRLFKAEVARFAPHIEDRGIDEIYVDFTTAPQGGEKGGRVLAEKIQQAVFVRTGLTCSIGVAPNKLIAKMASEFDKPNGISIVHAGDLADRIWPLPCRKVHGIGPKSDRRLQSMGIGTIGELAHYGEAALIVAFGKAYGAWMHAAAWGLDERPVITASEPVSISCETTFDRDLHAVRDREQLGQIFTTLCKRLAADLQRKGYVGRTIGVKLRYDNFQRLTRERTLEAYTADFSVIRRTAGLCLKRAPLERRLRLLGVKIGGLMKISGLPIEPPMDATRSLFAEAPPDRR